jgi:hypothetical protein
MKNRFQIIGVLALLLFITGRCGPRTKGEGSANDVKPSRAGLLAEKLDRSTALALIKRNRQRNNEDHVIYAYLPSAIYTDDLNPSAGNPLISAKQAATIKHANQANLEFYKALVANGLIRQETSCEIHKNITYRTYYCFAPNHPDVKSIGNPNNPEERGTTSDINIGIAMARPSSILVTGITQEGSDARAEVQIDITPTETYKLCAPIIASAESAYGEQYGDVVWRNFGWRELPGGLTKSDRIAKSFEKFDDGWRLRD